jgi:hypothetical protein
MKILSNLKKSIGKRRLSKLAQKRLGGDLKAVLQRLEKNEYETSSIVQNVFDMAEQSRIFYTYLQTHARIGETWSRIFESLSIDEHKEILDICPGFAPKIEIGLFYSNYKGKVVVLDKKKEAVMNLKKIMLIFRPNFEIIPYIHNIFSKTKRRFEFVVGNHIFDDIILEYFCEKNKLPSNNLYEKEGEFTKTWNIILKQQDEYAKEIVEKITEIFILLVDNEGYLCLAQYKSYMEKMLDLDKPYLFTKKVYKKVIENLCENGFAKIKTDDKIFDFKGRYFEKKHVSILKRIS